MEAKRTGRLRYPSWSNWGSFISRDPGNLAIYDLSKPTAFNTWWRWVADYRSRQLTQVNDRFAALAGIIKHYQTRTNDKPLAGLWERDLKYHLLWAYREPSLGAVKTQSLVDWGIPWRAPSWSWPYLTEDPSSRRNYRRKSKTQPTRQSQECTFSVPRFCGLESPWLRAS